MWSNATGSAIKNTDGSLSVAGNNSLISSNLDNDGKFKDWQGALASQATTSFSKNPSLSDATNKTENLSKQLFSDYLGLKSSGQADNSEAVQQVVDRIAREVDSLNTETSYTKKDLVINTSANSEDIREYANAFGRIRQSYRDEFSKRAANDSYFSPADKNFQTNMFFASSLYAAKAEQLLKLSVPSELADIHLRLINSYAGSGVGLEKMSLLQNDPLMSAVGVKQFSAESQKEELLLEELRRELSASGIVFTQNDSATLLWTN